MDECNEKNFGNVNNTHESNLSQINENKQNIQILQKNIQIMKENNENILKDVNNYKEELKNWQNQVMSLIVQNEKRLIRSEFNSLNESNKRENQDSLNNEDPLDVYQ
jgi:FtsZ-binding cell division protein ZapB